MSTQAQIAVGAKKRLPSFLAAAVGIGLLGAMLQVSRSPYVLPDHHAAAPEADLRIASLGVSSTRAATGSHSVVHDEHRTLPHTTHVEASNEIAASGLLTWPQARQLAADEARKIHEKNAPFIGHHLSGGWTGPITEENVLSRFRVDPSDVDTDAKWIVDEVRAEISDLRAEITWLTDQYFGIKEAAVERLLAAEPAHKSREPIPPSAHVRGGLQKISVDPSATGGWYVRYELRTADFPELFQLEQEILPLVSQCNRRARHIVEAHQRAALAKR